MYLKASIPTFLSTITLSAFTACIFMLVPVAAKAELSPELQTKIDKY
jgi:hypothetical protein